MGGVASVGIDGFKITEGFNGTKGSRGVFEGADGGTGNFSQIGGGERTNQVSFLLLCFILIPCGVVKDF